MDLAACQEPILALRTRWCWQYQRTREWSIQVFLSHQRSHLSVLSQLFPPNALLHCQRRWEKKRKPEAAAGVGQRPHCVGGVGELPGSLNCPFVVTGLDKPTQHKGVQGEHMDSITVPWPSVHIAAATHQMRVCRVEGSIFLSGF